MLRDFITIRRNTEEKRRENREIMMLWRTHEGITDWSWDGCKLYHKSIKVQSDKVSHRNERDNVWREKLNCSQVNLLWNFKNCSLSILESLERNRFPLSVELCSLFIHCSFTSYIIIKVNCDVGDFEPNPITSWMKMKNFVSKRKEKLCWVTKNSFVGATIRR